jgi:RNA polymerase sigma factor (sigma-70 family)
MSNFVDEDGTMFIHPVAAGNPSSKEDGTMFIHPVAAGNPSSKMVSDESVDILKWYISGLSQSFRQVATMYFVQQLPYEEISDILNMPYNTVKVKVMRARRVLKNQLSPLNFA